MAHIRIRFLSQKIEKTLKQSPSLSLLGMRQAGKTTLLKQFCRTYLTLDHDQTLTQFQMGNWLELEKGPAPIGVDECQKLPGLFDRVKLLIDQRNVMGRYILTGSVRFLSKKQIKESLTGRTLVLELLPMTIAESHSRGQRSFIDEVRKSKNFDVFLKNAEKTHWCSFDLIKSHLRLGGLPGICFKRDSKLRADLMEQHIDTLVSRDLPMLYETRVSATKLKLILRELALIQGLEWSVEGCARRVGISGPTLRQLLSAFEGLFLIRRVKNRVYLEDGGVSHFLVPNENLLPQQTLRSFVFRELLALIKYQYPRSVEISDYTTRGGVDIPFVVNDGNVTIGLTVDEGWQASEKSLKGLGKFQKKKSSVKCIAFHCGEDAYVATNGVWCLPLSFLV